MEEGRTKERKEGWREGVEEEGKERRREVMSDGIKKIRERQRKKS